MTDLYEREFGICPQTAAKENPLSSVLFHEDEDVWMNSRLRDLIEDYATYDYGSLWNLSLTEFLSLPMPYTQIMAKLRDKVMAKKNAELNNLTSK